jgi:hypothetical protein
MADEKQQTDEQAPEESSSETKGAPLWLIAVIALVGIAGITGTMFFLLDHVRQTYVIPYYQMLHSWEERADSLTAAAAAGIPPELVEGMELFRERSDSLTTVASEHNRHIEELEGQVENFEQQQQQLSAKDIKRLAGIFGAMKAPRAASIMINMDQATIVEILMLINQRNAAKIMAAMPTEKAAAIARQIQRRAEAQSGGS